MITKQQATLDTENHRYIVSPLTNNTTISIQQVLRVIKKTTSTTWHQLVEFTGLHTTSECFKICYTGNYQQDLVKKLAAYMTIDTANNRAYLYDKDHKPTGVVVPHVSPSITNGESQQTVYTLVPTKVLSRVTINDSLDRILICTLTPTNGYLLGVRDITISKPGMSYVVTGSKRTLNQLLDNIHFVGTTAGSGSVVIKVDDNEGDVASVSSTTISLTINASTVSSIPTVSIPTSQSAVLNVTSAFTPITVADTDNKILELNITPFGCKIEGFKSYLFALNQGEVRTICGRPSTINEEIAGLKITPLQTNAQIGVELVCGKTTIREYLKFTVSNYAFDVVMTPQTATINDYSGEPISNKLNFTGNYDLSFTVTAKATNCSVTYAGSASEFTSGQTYTSTGTLAEQQAHFNEMLIIVGETDGKIIFTCNDVSTMITVKSKGLKP